MKINFGKNGGFNKLFLIIPAAVVIVAAALMIFVFKFNNAESSDYREDFYWAEVREEDIQTDAESGVRYVDNQIIIRIADGADRTVLEDLKAQYNCEVVGLLSSTDTCQLRFSEHYTYQKLQEIVAEIAQNEAIEHAAVDVVIELESMTAQYDKAAPNDSEWKGFWDEDTVYATDLNWGMKAINAREAWDHIDDMSTVNVGIFDSMFYTRHKDLNFSKAPLLNLTEDEFLQKIAAGSDVSHGTHVSGTIAATFNNKKGVAGTAPDTNLFGVSFEGLNGQYSTSSQMVLALSELVAVNKCKVINMSVGCDSITFAASRNNAAAINTIKATSDEFSDFARELLDDGYEFVVCKSAGNQNSTRDTSGYKYIRDDTSPYGYVRLDSVNTPQYRQRYGSNFDNMVDFGNVDAKYDILGSITDPAVRDIVIVVGSVGCDAANSYSVSDFSQCGDSVDVVAPGEDIYSTAVDSGVISSLKSGYCYMDGTSMATPHVSGVAAMVFSVNPGLSGAEVKEIICENTSERINWTSGKSYGLLDAGKAVEEALERKQTNQEKDDDKKDGEKDNKNGGLVIDPSYPTGYDENTMKYMRMAAKDSHCTYMKNLNGDLERKNNDGSVGDLILYEEGFFTICGIDSSYIYLLKKSEGAGIYDIFRISKDGKEQETILSGINWCLHMDEEYFYFVPADNKNCIRRINRDTLVTTNFAEFSEPVEVMIEQDNGYMVVTKDDGIFASLLGGGSNYYYLINNSGALVESYGSDIGVEQYPRAKQKDGNYNTAVKYTSNGYLRATAQEVYLQTGNSFVRTEGISGWNSVNCGVITTLDNDSTAPGALPYKIVCYDKNSGAQKTITEANSNQAFFTMCRDDNGNWCYFDQTDTELILYTLSSDFKTKEEIKRFEILKLSCDLESCGMEIMDNRIYFYSMPNNTTANAIYRYDLILND